MTSDLHPGILGMFVRSIAILALPASDQVAWLRTLSVDVGDDISELADDFGSGFDLLPQLIANGWLREPVDQTLKLIDIRLEGMAGSEGPWTTADLATDPRWSSIRELAAQALAQI